MATKVPRLLEVNSIRMVDWAGLQTDIVGIIIKKLAIPDYLRFRAVCTLWNRVCSDVSNCPRIDPWLMLLPNLFGGAKFFSIPERKNQNIHISSTPTNFGYMWAPVGSSNGWLIYFYRFLGIMELVNPISGAQIELPPIGSKHFCKARLLDMNESNFTVAVICGDQKGYKVTRNGSNSWSSVESKHILVDVFKHRSQLYTIDIYGTVEVCAEPPRAWPDEDGRRWGINCLVETPAGDLIMVKRQYRDKFAVWILDKVALSWVQVDNIGEFALFMSTYNSVCFPVKDHPSLKANCVYFIDICSNLCAFNLEHGTKDLVEALGAARARSFLPHPRYLWFIPSLKSKRDVLRCASFLREI